MESKTFAGFAIGLFSGLVVGGAIALIYAPQSGKKTRKYISDTTGDVVDAVEGEVNDVLDSVKNVASEANRRGHSVVKAIKG